ncbi:MAG: hypothetical protein HYY30_02590 [Chloroflexi bacterium]|nr:hypothetical protein [Chloroflexota bacterium]
MSKHAKILIGLIAIGLLASMAAVSVASADEPPATRAASNNFYSIFIDKLANILGKTPEETRGAITQAQKDVVADALKQGKITQQQADRANERIDKVGAFLPLQRPGGPMPQGLRPGKPSQPLQLKLMPQGQALKSAAELLGVPPGQVMKDLRAGKSLAQIAQDHGKTRDQLKEAILENAQNAVQNAVANGKLTQEKADNAITKLQSNLDDFIDRAFKAKKDKPSKQQQ